MPHSFNISVDNYKQDQVVVNLEALSPKCSKSNLRTSSIGGPTIIAKIVNNENPSQKVTSRLFQFTCGCIKPILGSFETKGNG